MLLDFMACAVSLNGLDACLLSSDEDGYSPSQKCFGV